MQRNSRARRNLAMFLALSVAAIGFGAQPAVAAVEGNKAFNGYSHDIKVYNALGALDSGPVSAAGVGCSDRAPLYYSVGLANVALGGVTLGTSNTTSQASKSGNVQSVTSTFQATGVNLPLVGDVALHADAITVTSTVNYDTVAKTFTHSSTMNVTALTVGAPLLPPVISVTGTVAPDAVPINIPGVATVGLHRTQVLGSNAAGALGKMATGISVQIAGQTVNIAIGETYSALYGTPDQNWLFGAGEGVKVTTSTSALAVGPLVTAQVPCAGATDPILSSLASVTLPGSLGTLGAVTSSGEGHRNGLTATAHTTSQVLSVNLAGGLVTADAVGSTSHAETADGGQTVTTAGTSSTFTNLSVAGVPVSVNTPLNTIIQLPGGVGYVVVNGRTNYQSGVETIPLVVHLNPVGPTAAIDVVVARSYAFVLGPNTSAAAAAKATALLSESDALQSAITTELNKGELKKAGVAPKGLAKGWDKEKPEKKNKDR